MAELHESLIVSYRKSIFRRGFKESKSPMPTYRPDIFAQKTSRNGSILEQIIVEAEIKSTLFSEHTAHQLLQMQEYIEHQKRKRIRVRGKLLIPRGKQLRAQAKSLLESLFPEGTKIGILQR